MCGIVALLAEPGAEDHLQLIDTMMNTLAHRGPDESGSVVLSSDGVALGVRRLSIVDLAGGLQPMWDEEGRTCLAFNGEIYNSVELRRELEGLGHAFRTHHSDTEVLVHGYNQWGTELFGRLNGMFAVAIWDRRSRVMTIGRDRVGEKPLYVAKLPGGYAVASELKALFALPSLDREVDLVALNQYLSFDYVIGPRTMLRNVSQVGAGEWATCTLEGVRARPYWEPSVIEDRSEDSVRLGEFDRLLDDAVARRMVADVPVGVFLSGGLDSTTIAYYMQRHNDDVRSFSIGFEDRNFDESSYATLAAESLRIRHHVEVFSEDRVRALVPRIPEILDQPMGDQSIFPTFLLSSFAAGDVKVALGGDGSDELLMGYDAFKPLKVAWMMEFLPKALRKAAAGTARRLPQFVGSHRLRGIPFARRLDEGPIARQFALLGSFNGDGRWVLSAGARDQVRDLSRCDAPSPLFDGLASAPADKQTVIAYLRGYLQEDILVKVDRASMAASLEVRSPFLDPRITDFLLAVPTKDKLHGFTGKQLLRRLMRGRIPEVILQRRKKGFGAPVSRWLRSSLAPMVEEYLAPANVREGGFFDADAVQSLVADHLSGKRDRGNEIWLLLQFEMWRDRWLS